MAYETTRACRACRQTIGNGCVCANSVPALRRNREVTVDARVVGGFRTNGVLTLICETPAGTRFHVTPADGDTITPKET